MDETTDTTARRRRLAGLGLGGIVLAALLAIAIGTPAALVVATGRTCACAQPPDVIVVNGSTDPVTLTWRQAGLVGALDGHHGTERVEACAAFTTTFPQGRIKVTVTSTAATRTFELDIPQRFASDPFGRYVVGRDGAVQDATRADPVAAPDPAACGIMGS